jgi:hypothetical protein
MANQNFTSVGNLEMVFEDLEVLADSVNPPLALLDRQGGVIEKDGVSGKLNFLGNETNSSTQRANASSIVVSNNLQLSLGGHGLDLLDELALVPVEEVVDDNVGRKLFRKDGGRSEVPGNNDALASRKLLDLNLLGGENLELGGEVLDSESEKSFLLRGSTG